MSGWPLLLDGLWCHVHIEVMLIGVTREVALHCLRSFPIAVFLTVTWALHPLMSQSLSHHFLHPNDPLRSATSGQHLWTTFSLWDLELPHPCGLSLDLCLMGFPLNPQAMLYIDQVASSLAQTLPEPQKSISLRRQHIQFWNCEGLFIVFSVVMSDFALMYINQNTEKMTQQFQCISVYLGRCEKEETILLYLLLCVLGLFTTQSLHCSIVSSAVTCHHFKSAPPLLVSLSLFP